MPPETGNNQDIANALAEFEATSGPLQVPRNPNAADELVQVQINIEPSKMVQRVMKYSGGMIKNEEQANYILFGLALLFFAASAYFFFS